MSDRIAARIKSAIEVLDGIHKGADYFRGAGDDLLIHTFHDYRVAQAPLPHLDS